MKKLFTSSTKDPFGAQKIIDAHRIEAAKHFDHPEHVTTNSTSEPAENGDGHVYTITTAWQDGPAPEPVEDQA